MHHIYMYIDNVVPTYTLKPNEFIFRWDTTTMSFEADLQEQ